MFLISSRVSCYRFILFVSCCNNFFVGLFYMWIETVDCCYQKSWFIEKILPRIVYFSGTKNPKKNWNKLCHGAFSKKIV